MASDGPEDGYNIQYAPDETDEPSISVVEAVARANGTGVGDLPPLHSVIDTGCLNRLFGERSRDVSPGAIGPKDAEPTLIFDYDGCEVSIEKERIHVEPISD